MTHGPNRDWRANGERVGALPCHLWAMSLMREAIWVLAKSRIPVGAAEVKDRDDKTAKTGVVHLEVSSHNLHPYYLKLISF